MIASFFTPMPEGGCLLNVFNWLLVLQHHATSLPLEGSANVAHKGSG